MSKVLVLNASYEPLNITGWRRAVILMLKGKAEQIEHNGKYLYRDFPLPTVIRLRQYVKVPYREIPLTRRNILNRDNHSCQYCGYTGSDLTLDHVIPRSRGGVDSWENLTTACMRCNVKKGSRSPKEANLSLCNQPRRPHSSLHYEAASQINNGTHAEWRKYVIGIE
jgi:5-methylcytosine-specific restriction endonuclease McrA